MGSSLVGIEYDSELAYSGCATPWSARSNDLAEKLAPWLSERASSYTFV